MHCHHLWCCLHYLEERGLSIDFGVDIEKKQAVEDLQIRLRGLESRISVLKEELESLESEKQQILRDIRANSDERYEEVALQKLYEQRRRK